MMKIPRGKYHTRTIHLIKAFVWLFLMPLRRGKRVEEFENKLKEDNGRRFCLTTSSCRMAFYELLKAMDLEKGDEVILGPITVPDMVNAIIAAGLKPVFADLSLDDHSINPFDLPSKVSEKSKVLLITHLSGLSTQMQPIVDFCQQHSLTLIEDISQSHGAYFGGKKLGSFGEYALISFSTGKGISTLIGGALLTNNGDVFEKVKEQVSGYKTPNRLMFVFQLLENFKIAFLTHPVVFSYLVFPLLQIYFSFFPYNIDQIHKENWISKIYRRDDFFDDLPMARLEMPESFRFQFTNWQAEIGLATLRDYEGQKKRRQNLAARFLEKLEPELLPRFPRCLAGKDNNVFNHLPLYVGNQKSEVQHHLLNHGIDTGSYMLTLCSHASAFSPFAAATPTSRLIKEDLIFLPTHEDLSLEQMDMMASAVNQFFLGKS